jgi:hemerythrin superfamily protein
MDIYTYLKKDHQTVADLFDKILSTKSISKRRTWFEEVKNELLLHAESENATFYAALKEHEETEEIAGHAEKEHAEVKDYLEKLSRLSIEGEKWMEQLGELKHSVTHHVAEEEGEIFEGAKKVLNKEQAKQLAIDMEAAKERLKIAA